MTTRTKSITGSTSVGECCPPLGDRLLDDADAITLASAFSALADPARLRRKNERRFPCPYVRLCRCSAVVDQR